MNVMAKMLVAAALLPAAAAAEEGSARPARTELGVGIMGLSVRSQDGETLTGLGLPNPGLSFLSSPRLYAGIPLSRRWMVEPQVGFTYFSGDDDKASLVSFAGQADYFFEGTSRPSAFAFGFGRLDHVDLGDFSDSTTKYGLGGGLGYRIPIGDRGVIRVEGRYDHTLASDGDSGASTFSVGASLGLGL
jgi:hypothetical protein